MNPCFIGLGANIGNSRATLAAAITQLAQLPNTHLVRCSRFFRSAPIAAQGDDFCNAVVQLNTALLAPELLSAMQAIEQQFGRERPYPNAPRTLDLDLLLYGAAQIHTTNLQVPHPRLTERAFVLRPLLEICPEIQIPGLGAAREFLAGVNEQVICEWDGQH
jgi:2-amino-4-hydroxy-6-hydroxymethyldihydropteridine diphosphokinase